MSDTTLTRVINWAFMTALTGIVGGAAWDGVKKIYEAHAVEHSSEYITSRKLEQTYAPTYSSTYAPSDDSTYPPSYDSTYPPSYSPSYSPVRRK